MLYTQGTHLFIFFEYTERLMKNKCNMLYLIGSFSFKGLYPATTKLEVWAFNSKLSISVSYYLLWLAIMSATFPQVTLENLKKKVTLTIVLLLLIFVTILLSGSYFKVQRKLPRENRAVSKLTEYHLYVNQSVNLLYKIVFLNLAICMIKSTL